MGMRSKGLLLAGMLVCPLAQGEPAWLVETTMALQQIDIEVLDVGATCGQLKQIAFQASHARSKGQSMGSVVASTVGKARHPLIDMRDYERRAIRLVYSRARVGNEEAARYVDLECTMGLGEFSELKDTLLNTPLAPYALRDDYLERTCAFYGDLASSYRYSLAKGRPEWWLRERGPSHKLQAMAFQLELIDFVIDYHGPTPVGEYVETQCRTRSGIFQ